MLTGDETDVEIKHIFEILKIVFPVLGTLISVFFGYFLNELLKGYKVEWECKSINDLEGQREILYLLFSNDMKNDIYVELKARNFSKYKTISDSELMVGSCIKFDSIPSVLRIPAKGVKEIIVAEVLPNFENVHELHEVNSTLDITISRVGKSSFKKYSAKKTFGKFSKYHIRRQKRSASLSVTKVLSNSRVEKLTFNNLEEKEKWESSFNSKVDALIAQIELPDYLIQNVGYHMKNMNINNGTTEEIRLWKKEILECFSIIPSNRIMKIYGFYNSYMNSVNKFEENPDFDTLILMLADNKILYKIVLKCEKEGIWPENLYHHVLRDYTKKRKRFISNQEKTRSRERGKWSN